MSDQQNYTPSDDEVRAWQYQPRCDLCGKFRKVADATVTGNEAEVWMVCRWCASPAERQQYGWEDPMTSPTRSHEGATS